MLPTSHLVPTNVPPYLPGNRGDGEALLLADAFSEFIEAAGTLESSYRDLQAEVAQLALELAARNRQLEESLRANEQMRLTLVELVDLMPCGVLVLGEEGLLLRMNPEAKRLLALPVEKPAPSNLDEVLAWTGMDLLALSAIEGESEIAFEPIAEDRAQRWMELRTRRVRGAHGGAQTILILVDISAHKQAEQDREAGRRALALAEVAATLAHEVRNPLASLELFLGLLEDEPDRNAEWVKHLRAGLRSLGSTVNNVLAFHGTGRLHLAPLVLQEAIGAAAEFVRPVAMQAGIALRVEPGSGRHTVAGNEAALQQMVLNLVMNAVRHTPAGGSITVSLAESVDGFVRVSVADTGCGIQADQIDSVFTAGWSASGTSSGLGLAVCRRIAAQHGAVLQVASQDGCGARFHMDLPVIASSAEVSKV